MSLLVTLLVSLAARADVKEIDLQVKGLVCAFCANGLKATLGRDPAVGSVVISLEKRQVRLFTTAPLADADINRLVDEAGFTVEKIDRLAN